MSCAFKSSCQSWNSVVGCSNRLDYSLHWLTVTGLVGLTVLIAVFIEKISWVLHLYTVVGWSNRLDYSLHWLTGTGLVGLTVLIAVYLEKISWVVHLYTVVDWLTPSTGSIWPGWPDSTDCGSKRENIMSFAYLHISGLAYSQHWR